MVALLNQVSHAEFGLIMQPFKRQYSCPSHRTLLLSPALPQVSARSMPVSYTHLDVYKRQIVACALYALLANGFGLGKPLDFSPLAQAAWFGPVSYTHLFQEPDLALDLPRYLNQFQVHPTLLLLLYLSLIHI